MAAESGESRRWWQRSRQTDGVDDSAQSDELAETPPDATNAQPKRGKRRRRKWILIAALSVLIVFIAVTARVFIWPDLPRVPEHVDAIIELGGPAPFGRDDVALDLARKHRAEFLIQSTVVAEAGTDRCLPPVPDVTIMCFHAEPNTTQGEAEYIGQQAQLHHWTSVVLVTTPDQAWRARLRVTRCFPGKVYVATASLPLLEWPQQIAYQWVASAKALISERTC